MDETPSEIMVRLAFACLAAGVFIILFFLVCLLTSLQRLSDASRGHIATMKLRLGSVQNRLDRVAQRLGK